MRAITLREIEWATEGKILNGNPQKTACGICTDSRQIKEGELFIPIVGEVYDAHTFIPQAAKRGCAAVLTARAEAVPAGINAVLVEDTTRALQKLAAWYLNTLNLKKIAVTGSVGKTSTRDMAYYILREKYAVGTTVGNFNNDIGVPLTIFTFDDSMQAAVLEVGMDHSGEIHRLVDMIRPDVGIITNVGISHIENLGSREGILRAKMEIADYFDENSTLVLNHDNDMLAGVEDTGAYKVVRVGSGAENQYRVSAIEDRGGEGVSYRLTCSEGVFQICLKIPGAHNALNSALAIAGCRLLGVSVEEAIRGLSKLELTGKRLTICHAGQITVIDDTYNAAPDSMKSAIDTLIHTPGGRKIAILAGMNELGEESRRYHREIGQYAAQRQIDLLVTVGEKALDIALGAEAEKTAAVRHYETKEAFLNDEKMRPVDGDVILVKGSRTMEMERIVDKILKEQE